MRINSLYSLKQYCLTKGDTPWYPSSFSDQVAGKFYQQAIDNERKNSLNTKSDHYFSSDIKVDIVEQDIPNYHTLIHRMHMIQMSKENMQI
jgi:hypothetical protein